MQLNLYQHFKEDNQSQTLLSFMISFCCHDTGSLFVISTVKIKKKKKILKKPHIDFYKMWLKLVI